MVEAAIRAGLYARLRQPPMASTVPGTLPVLFFGDLYSAEVASVGLNPSNQEYTTRGGAMLSGSGQRFATLASLRAADRDSLSDEQCEAAIGWMRGYFKPGSPVYGWFRGLDRVVGGFGASFAEGRTAHLDLVQEATKPTWSALPPAERDALLAADLPFLEWEIRAFPVRAVLSNGATVGRHVRQRFQVVVGDSGTLALVDWWVGEADVDGRRVIFAGWNRPLIRPTGLGKSGEAELGQLLAEAVARR